MSSMSVKVLPLKWKVATEEERGHIDARVEPGDSHLGAPGLCIVTSLTHKVYSKLGLALGVSERRRQASRREGVGARVR